MRIPNRVIVIVLIVYNFLCFDTCKDEMVLGQSSNNDFVASAIRDLVLGNTGKALQLAEDAPDALVPALISAMQDDDSLARGAGRQVMGRLRPIRSDESVAAIMTGLKDSRACDACAIALPAISRDRLKAVVETLAAMVVSGETPETCRGSILRVVGFLNEETDAGVFVEALGKALEQIEVETPDNAIRLLRSLAQYGATAMPLLPRLKEIINDEHLDKQVRYTAAYAMLKVGSLSAGIDLFEQLELKPHRLLIAVVAQCIMEADKETHLEPNPVYEAERHKARMWLLRAVEHPDAEVRLAAVEHLGVAWGTDWVVFREGGAYEWNPVPRGALEVALVNETDLRVREAIESRLSLDIHRAAARLLRDFERARAEKNKQSNEINQE